MARHFANFELRRYLIKLSNKCRLVSLVLSKKIVIEFSQKSIRSIFILHLIVGVLKTASLQETATKAVVNDEPLTGRSRTAALTSKRAETAYLQRATSSNFRSKEKNFAQNRSVEHKRTEVNLELGPLANLEGAKRADFRGPDKTMNNLLRGKTKKKRPFPQHSVDHGGRISDIEASREIVKDQDIIVNTLFTDVELNRIIVNVGGGYLLKHASSRRAQLSRATPPDNVDQYCYLGLGQMTSKTKKRRGDLHVQHLLS